MTNPGVNPGEHEARVRDAYSTCVNLVDQQLQIYSPERDDLPAWMCDAMGLDISDTETVRYNVLETPERGSCPEPFSSVLSDAAVIAFQAIRHDTRPYRKIELIDPFRAVGGVTLLMLGLEEPRDDTGLPRANVRGEAVDMLEPTRGGPFNDPGLTDNIAHMAVTIRRMVGAGKLVPISHDDIQAMYALQNDLENN